MANKQRTPEKFVYHAIRAYRAWKLGDDEVPEHERRTPEPMARMGVAAYSRASQAGGIEQQAQDNYDYWGDWGHPFRPTMRFADDGVPGDRPLEQRPVLLAAIHELEDGRASVLLVRSLDRLARDGWILEQILARVWRAGGEVFTLDPPGRVGDDGESRRMRRRFTREYEAELDAIRARRARPPGAPGSGAATPAGRGATAVTSARANVSTNGDDRDLRSAWRPRRVAAPGERLPPVKPGAARFRFAA